MLFSIFCMLLVILVAGFWTNQGLYSATIMFFESVIAMMLGIGFHEPAAAMLKDFISPQLGEPGCLVIIFLASLIAMRLATDKYLRGNIRLPTALDRGVAAVFAFFTAEILIGTITLAAQMMPLGRTVLGFERWDSKLTRRRTLAVFNPDGFVVALAHMLGTGRFAWSEPGLAASKPDWLNELHYRRSGPQPQCRVVLPADALAIGGLSRVDQIQELKVTGEGKKVSRDTQTVAEKRDPGATYFVCRVSVAESAAEKDQPFISFTPAQFRMVGPRPGQAGNPPKAYPAVGMSDIYIAPPFESSEEVVSEEQAAVLVRYDADTPLCLTSNKHKALLRDGRYHLDVVFEAPTEDFVPWYVEFKSGARQPVTTEKVERRAADGAAPAADEPAGEPADSTSEAPADGGRRADPDRDAGSGDRANARRSGGAGSSRNRDDRRNNPADSGGRSGGDANSNSTAGGGDVKIGQAPEGRTHLATAIEDRTGESDLLPIPLPKAALTGRMRESRLSEAHVVLDTPSGEIPADERVEKFWVPDGKKMVQVGAEAVSAKSFLGRPLELARSVLGQYHLQTADETSYFAVGMYIEANIDGRRRFEIQYHPEPEMPERALQEPKELRRNNLAGRTDYKFGFIFLVDPGAHITHFRTDGRGGGQELEIQVSQ